MENKGTEAWNLHNKIKQNEMNRRLLMLDSMEALHTLHSKKLYRAVLGDEDAPWTAYLGQHDTYYSASQVYTLDKIYQKFIVELKVNPKNILEIPTTKLSNLVPIVTMDNVVEWLTKAETLTNFDFQDEIRKSKGKKSYLDCTHQFTPYQICSSCGFRHKGEHNENI